jgi:transcriptional regulator with XRE-family HTH domain
MTMEAEKRKLDVAPGRAVEMLEQGLGLSRGELAGFLGASARTVERWRTGRTYPQHEMRERLAGLIDLERHLGETFDDTEAVRSWMRSGNPYLGGLTPLEVLHAGRPDRVRAALEALDSGVFV